MSKQTADLDRMVEFAMAELLSGDGGRCARLVRRMAETWPGEPALAITYSLTTATAAIEDSFGDASADDPVILLGYRLSSLVAADIHAILSMGKMHAVAEDLLHFWRRTDPAYLGLSQT